MRSQSGCKKCRERKKKCDEIKPVCGACHRLKLECHWTSSIRLEGMNDSASPKTIEMTVFRRPSSVLTQIPPADVYLQPFDDPSIMQASATSVIRNTKDKHGLQYLCEVGTGFLRFPNQLVPGYSNFNTFRLGFQMASHSPPHVRALVAIGSGHLGRSHDKFRIVALNTYGKAMRALLDEVQRSEVNSLPEWTCAVASLLAVYQLVMFDSPKERLSHLLGFFHLCEARLNGGLPWGPLQILLEHYIHSLTVNVLFQFRHVAANKSVSYAADLISQLNSRPRAFGKEVSGVPEILTNAAYKLSYLNHKPVDQAPWVFELNAVSKSIQRWEHPTYALKPSAEGLFMVGKLYQLACLCFADYLVARSLGRMMDQSRVERYVAAAADAVGGSMLCQRPFNSISWPLIVLGVFAQRIQHRSTLLRPLITLAEDIGVAAYGTAVEFLQTVWLKDLGSIALADTNILERVYI